MADGPLLSDASEKRVETVSSVVSNPASLKAAGVMVIFFVTNAGADTVVTVSVVVPEMLPDVAIMVDVPAATPVASPVFDIVALLAFDELHVAEPVIFCVVLSEYVPVAVNCCVALVVMLGLAGVTAIDTSVAVWVVIVNVAVPEILPDVAVIVVVPAATAVANPTFEILALLVSEEVQVTDAEIFWVELSEYVPVAMNC
jgi:hypothetical protein